MAVDDTSATAQASREDADTYGWDSAFAINFSNANTAIANSWSAVGAGAKNVDAAADDPSYHISGVLGPWQLTVGGDGRNIRMSCPFVSGTYTAGASSYNLGATRTRVVIEIGMEWVPDPDQFFFVIHGPAVAPIRTALDDSTLAGALRDAFTAQGRTLGQGAEVTRVTEGTEWMITDGGDNYYIFHSTDKYAEEFLNVYQFRDAWKNNLKVLAEAASSGQPAVTIMTIVNNPATGVAAAVLQQLLSDWFNTRIGEFNHVFASLDLSPIVSESDAFAWLRPTSTSYAVTDEGTPDTSVFGVLTMALGRESSNNHQVSPYAIPAGSNAGFLISGPMFVRNMLLAGARLIFNGAPEDSFSVENDGLTVRNTKDLVWGKFMMDDKKKGSVRDDGYSAQLDNRQLSDALITALSIIRVPVSGYGVQVTTAGSQWLLAGRGRAEYILSRDGSHIDVYEATIVNIAKGRFTMTLNHTYVEIQFIDLLYSYSSDFDVHIDYTEQVQLSLKEQGGRKIFWFDQIIKNQVVTVARTQEAITREIVMGAVTAAIGLIAIAGPIAEGLAAGARVGRISAEGGQAVIDAETVALVERENPLAAEADLASSGAAASEQAAGRLTRIENAFATPKWKVAASIAALAAAATGAEQALEAIIENAAKNQWEKVPGFDDFARLAIAPYAFPSVPGFTLTGAGLAGSLQIGLTMKGA